VICRSSEGIAESIRQTMPTLDAESEIVQLPGTKWMRRVWEVEEHEPSFRRHHQQIHHAKPSEMIGYLIPDANTILVMGKRLAHRNFCILKKQNNLNFPTSHLRPKPVSQYGRL
jgi:hypothetical protein